MDEKEMRQMLQDEAMKLPDLGIVVSGISGRFPKANSVNEFEDALFHGKDLINDNDSSRFECGLWNLPPRHGRLKDITKFDNEFFNISDQQANETDHQLRILYEVVYEAILDAGINPAEMRGSNTGVYVGLHTFEFDQSLARDKDSGSFGYYGQLGPKVAKYFDFRGFAGSFDTACASVFTALNAAVTEMNQGLVDRAIVAGSTIPVNPNGNCTFNDLGMLSPTGYCYFLDGRANGYVKSEACVAILLQKKTVALRNYCSIMASLAGADGFKSEGITFPSSDGQANLIREANNFTGITTNHIEYIEAHGTGTPAGDPIECEAIANVYFAPKQDPRGEKTTTTSDMSQIERKIGPLLIGSVKTNMGHPEGPSGLCALVKVALMLENELIYRSLHFEQPNPNIKSLIEGKLKPIVETQKLVAKIIPMSNYGFGGANNHVIVRSSGRSTISPREFIDVSQTSSPRLVVMFGRTRESLEFFFDSILNEKSRHTGNCLSDDFLALLDSLSKGNIDRLMNHRGYLIVDRGSSREGNRELARKIEICNLKKISTSTDDSSTLSEFTHFQDAEPRKCNLILPGLGSQWPKMATHLMSYKPFWSTVERLSRILASSEQRTNLIHLLTTASAQELNSSTSNQFVSVIAYEIALINIIRDQLGTNNLGSIVGHSIGEIACAYAVGLLDERQAILVAYRLGKTLDEHSESLKGKMVALELSEHEAVDLLSGYQTLRVSCVNGPSSVTISGRIEEVDKLCATIGDKIRCTHIESSSIAIHNETIMTQDIKNMLRESIIEVLQPHENSSQQHLSQWYSSVDLSSETNKFVLGDAEYFANCLCKRVVFDKAIKNLEDDSVALELGPSGIFGSQLRQSDLSLKGLQKNRRKPKVHYVRLMQCDTFTKDQQVIRLLRGIGELYLHGITFSRSTQFHMNSSSQVEELFPVRRQTPSLSSLIRWSYDKSFFVPRYPLQFSKSLSRTIITIDINDPKRAYVVDHQIEGRILFPATGYLLLVWQYFSRIKTKSMDGVNRLQNTVLVPVEFHDVRLLNACVLSKEHSVEMLMRLEDSSGQFEISENGNLLVQGFVKSPKDPSSDLLYLETKNVIEREKGNAEELTNKDVYKQFRVLGYDYGEYFQNIVSSSSDGRHFRVKYNGYFDSFTDSIIQSSLLTLKNNGKSSGLLLPTGFEYIRFEPSLIMGLLSETDTPFYEEDPDKNSVKKPKSDEASTSIFNVFCDPLSGVVITNGIEIKGIKMTHAPRRSDSRKVLLESYQFVSDIEEPIRDITSVKRDRKTHKYVQVCNYLAKSVISDLYNVEFSQLNNLLEYDNGLDDMIEVVKDKELFEEKYLKKFLTSIWDGNKMNDNYDHKLNGNYTLMSILDQLSKTSNISDFKWIIDQFGMDQPHDLIQLEITNERLLRSLLELVIENVCQSVFSIGVLDVNLEEISLKEELMPLMIHIEPSLTIDYNTLQLSVVDSNGSGVLVRDIHIDESSSINKDSKPSNNLNLVVYKDSSCTSLSKLKQEEKVDTLQLLRCLANPLEVGGFVMVFLRQELTLAERIVILIRESSECSFKFKGQKNEEKTIRNLVGVLNESNQKLRMRCKCFIDRAKEANLMFVSRKSDEFGSTILLFRKMKSEEQTNEENKETRNSNSEAESGLKTLIRVTHDNREQISQWLQELKANFNAENKETQGKNIVWLCGIETRQQSVSGVVGMMQALRKELGSQRLRCFYDAHTFNQCDEPISVDQIEQSENFRRALERDLLWNCVDAKGNFGSFRHFTVNEYFNHEECLCSNNPVDEEESNTEFDKSNSHMGGAYVNYAKRGDMSSFSWYQLPPVDVSRSSAQQDTVCTVAYSALNFRDVMLASGRLSADIFPDNLALQDCMLGMEFSGCDGQDRRLMGIVPSGAIATHVICAKDTSLLVEVPDWMSLKEAATIPVVYATAIMAMIYRGNMQCGESILIHAGSGGVGQAAIRLAAYFGLTIYTTVGTDDKRKFLLEEFGDHLSEERIFSSRDCRFEEEVMKQTGGVGVDLVLNSLSDEKLRASVRCLSDGGRFLEIGKYDMSVNSTLELPTLDTNKTFHGVSLDKLFESNKVTSAFKQQMANVFETLSDGLRLGFIKPIKHVSFKRDQIEEAFRYMATGSHIGKVLIEVNPLCDKQLATSSKIHRPINFIPQLNLSSHKTYIITGGLGGFGLELIKWLVSVGASHFVITSRTGVKTSYQSFTLEKLASEKNVTYTIVDKQTADTRYPGGIEKLFCIALDLSPTRQIGGVFHLAMILKDSLLDNMSPEDFELVCKPKVDTCIHMDRVSRSLQFDIDYFVAFSSVTSGKGNIGQANYAYANSCLERICERRRADGLHGMAIQWGVIGDVGVAYENLGGNDMVIGGTLPQRIPSCMETLSKLLCSPLSVCLSIVPSDSNLNSATAKGDALASIMNILGLKNTSKIAPGVTLGELGLDSLMAVEVRQYLQREHDATITLQDTRTLTLENIREMISKKNITKDGQINSVKVNGSNDNVKHMDNYGQLLNKTNNMTVDYRSYVIENLLGLSSAILLPNSRFCLINDSEKMKRSLKPIFFIPPFDGSFRELSHMCSHIERPCIGINWTTSFSEAQNMEELVETYIETVQSMDWRQDCNLEYSLYFNKLEEVDLVGYSFGATVAFLMMIQLEQSVQVQQIKRTTLAPGNLVLLDGSPKELEFMAFLLRTTAGSELMTLEQKLDESLLVFVNAKLLEYGITIDTSKLYIQLSERKIEDKCSIASQKFIEHLKHHTKQKESEINNSNNQIQYKFSEDDYQFLIQDTNAYVELAEAMKSFCKHMILMENFQVSPQKLAGNCTLIKAQESLVTIPTNVVKDESTGGLRDIVEGEVNLLTLKGTHKSFLENSSVEIAEIICNQCDCN